jgi:hypothetical protein
MTKSEKILALTSICLLTAISCHKEKPPCGCGTEDPIKNLEWLSFYINFYNNDVSGSWDEVSIYMYDFRNSNAFLFDTKKSGIYDVPITIRDCTGKTIFICGGLQPPQLDSCNIFSQLSSNKTLVWSKKY